MDIFSVFYFILVYKWLLRFYVGEFVEDFLVVEKNKEY